MILDSTVLVDMLRDKSGECRARLRQFLRGSEYFLTRFTQLELLRGSRNEAEWTELASYINDQYYVETSDQTWSRAARIYFELRKRGQTVRSMIDCCIAQLAIEHDLTLIHNDRDFEIVAGVRPLRHVRLDLKAAP
jgi:predicted nucleic acid-binding protein